jgi:hypothetical protein
MIRPMTPVRWRPERAARGVDVVIELPGGFADALASRLADRGARDFIENERDGRARDTREAGDIVAGYGPACHALSDYTCHDHLYPAARAARWRAGT